MTSAVGYLHRYGVPSMPPYVTGDRVWRDLYELRVMCAKRNSVWGADDYWRGILKKCVNGQAVYPLSEQDGLKAQERRYTAYGKEKH